jgi:hypothetical protein
MSNSRSTYRANRRADQEPTLLERYGERHIVSFFRYNMEERLGPNIPNPNHDFGKEVEDAARLDEKIVGHLPFGPQTIISLILSQDLFDKNEGLLDQVIFGIQFPDLCHPGVREFVGDRRLVALLLVRHFKKSGGLVLPPLDGAQQLSEAHAQTVRADMAAGRQPMPMHYPNW